MINKKHLLKLMLIFLVIDIILCPIVTFTDSGISFLEYAAISAFGLVGFLFFFFILWTVFNAEFYSAFSGNAIVQLTGTFIGLIGCAIKLHEGTEYLMGFAVLIPLFSNAVIWEYFPQFYLKDYKKDKEE